jgi:hypothetical protein
LYFVGGSGKLHGREFEEWTVFQYVEKLRLSKKKWHRQKNMKA